MVAGISPYTGLTKGTGLTYLSGLTFSTGLTDIGGDNPTINYNFLSGSLPSDLTFSRASNATYFDSAGVLQLASTNTPRFDYNPATLAARGLLIEQASTNKVFNSGQVGTTGWVNPGISATLNNLLAPDGTITGTLITNTTGTAGAAATFSISSTAAGTQTISCFVKRGNNATVAVGSTDNVANSARVLFNFDTLALTNSVVIGNGSVLSSSYQVLPNGWYRVTVTINYSGVTSTQLAFVGAWNDTAGANTVSQTVYAWGLQDEALSFATSYIPTAGATATRARDNLTNSSIPWFNALGGAFTTTWLASHTVPLSILEVASAFNDGTLNNIITLQANGFGGQRCSAQIITGGVSQFNEVVGSAIVAGTTYKQGVSYSAAQNISGLNGLTPVTITAGISLPTVNQLVIGTTVGAAAPFTGWIQSFKYYNTAKTSAQLQALTS